MKFAMRAGIVKLVAHLVKSVELPGIASIVFLRFAQLVITVLVVPNMHAQASIKMRSAEILAKIVPLATSALELQGAMRMHYSKSVVNLIIVLLET
jgi:hypothetical protein